MPGPFEDDNKRAFEAAMREEFADRPTLTGPNPGIPERRPRPPREHPAWSGAGIVAGVVVTALTVAFLVLLAGVTVAAWRWLT